MWDIPISCINLLIKQIKNSDDDIVKAYALKAIENITSQSELGGAKFCVPEFVGLLISTFNNQNSSPNIKNSCAVSLTNIGSMTPNFLSEIVKKISLRVMINSLKDGDKRLQQAFMTILNLYIFHCGESACKEIQEHFKILFQNLMNFLEHGAPILKSKSLLMITLLGINDFSVLNYTVDGKFMLLLDKIFQERNKNVQQVLEK